MISMALLAPEFESAGEKDSGMQLLIRVFGSLIPPMYYYSTSFRFLRLITLAPRLIRMMQGRLNATYVTWTCSPGCDWAISAHDLEVDGIQRDVNHD